jgi:hypothetical protein
LLRLGALLVGAALATPIAGCLDGDSDNGEARAAPPRGWFVDAGSVGGRCTDDRPARRARSVRRPWCSIGTAARRLRSGGRVYVRRGSYGMLTLGAGVAPARTLVLRPYPGERVTLGGVRLTGARSVRLQGFRIKDAVKLSGGSRRVAIVGNELSPGGIALASGSRQVLIAGNRLHDNPTGFPFIAMAGDISGVTIRGNRILRFGGDGIQFSSGSLRGLRIERNEIAFGRTDDPAAHNDPIQIVHGAGVVIRSNYVHDNEFGLMLGGEGQLSSLRLENNLVVRTGSYALQLGARSDGAQLVNNTWWDNRYGVILRAPLRGVVFVNNIVDVLAAGREMFAREESNLIARGYRGRGDIRGRPRFAARGKDYHLAPGSPGIDAGSAAGAPARDRRGRRRVDDPTARNRGQGARSFYDVGSEERRPR